MAYLTEIPDAFLTVGADLTIVNLPPTQLINLFSPSQEIGGFDIDSPTGDTLTQGDNITPVDSMGQPIEEGTYLGQATLLNAGANVGLPGIANIGLTVNPIEGQLMQDEDGNVFMITDDELSADRLSVTATITVAGQDISVTAPASEIVESLASAVSAVPVAGPGVAVIIRAGADTVQSTLDTTIITMEFDPEGTFPLDDADVVPCFAAGTLIATQSGLVPVQDIVVGQLVQTRDHGLQPVRWVGSVTVTSARLALAPNLRPIRIDSGALGQNQPRQPLVVSPQHRVLIRSAIAQRMFGASEILVGAKQLLGMPGVTRVDDMTPIRYVHIMFDRHEIVVSNGAETESLYAGAQALKAVGPAARKEIIELFPSLAELDVPPEPARDMPKGRLVRKLLERHARNSKDLVS